MAQEVGIREVLEQVNSRLNRVETAIDDLRKEVHTNFRWIVGIMLTMWATIIAVVLGALIAG